MKNRIRKLRWSKKSIGACRSIYHPVYILPKNGVSAAASWRLERQDARTPSIFVSPETGSRILGQYFSVNKSRSRIISGAREERETQPVHRRDRIPVAKGFLHFHTRERAAVKTRVCQWKHPFPAIIRAEERFFAQPTIRCPISSTRSIELYGSSRSKDAF